MRCKDGAKARVGRVVWIPKRIYGVRTGVKMVVRFEGTGMWAVVVMSNALDKLE